MEKTTLHRIILGRFNPPHLGHEKMLKRASTTTKFGADCEITTIFLSPKEGTPDNPLTYSDRVGALWAMVGMDGIIIPLTDTGFYGVMKTLYPRSKTDIIQFIGGSDRIGEYADRFFKLRNKPEMDPILSEVHVVFSEVPRESELFSSTFAREMAADGHYRHFAAVMPKSLDQNTIKYLYEQIRKGILQNDNKGSD